MKKKIFLSMTMACALVACVKESGIKNASTPIQNPVLTSITGNSDPEEVARAGEQLITPTGFFYADRIFDLALSADPQNVRAGFYKNILKPYMAYKGIFARVRPLAVKMNKVQELDAAIAKVKDENLKAFLLNGKGDIENEVGIQNFLVEFREAFNSIRKFAKNNKDAQLTVYFPDYVWNSTSESHTECQFSQNGSREVSEVNCVTRHDSTEKYSKSLQIGQAEIEGLQQVSAGIVFQFSILSSYSWEGYQDVSDAIANKKLRPPQLLSMIKAMPKFLRLREDHAMKTLGELGTDLAIAARWVLANQETLCKAEKKGICIDEDPVKFLADVTKLESAIQGPFLTDLVLQTGASYSTQVDPFVISRKPIQDLKSLFPLTVDNCGAAYGLSDKTMGGILPNADGEFLMARPKPCDK